ncbi:MAG: DNA gyrase subunit A [Christensenellaceae bacterium]|jgi:DNA gyrase subunit A|nr:DNA gyrase subunit A [Christensenellaceae bacterium]
MEKKGTGLNIEHIKESLAKTKIVPINVKDEMSKSFISYAMAVNVSRAIPDVRDGLKPVHRRILYAMYEINNTHDKPYKKCARIVGEVLGKYHPHGDSSIYDALVRLAQDFTMSMQLIDGHGNFGSVDGDAPAAARYTEARLSKIADELLRDLDKNTVDTYLNFDDTLTQPVVLPAKFPNLLVNGSEGIAVGMATSIPPHNLSEIINATIAIIDNPDISIDELISIVPAPDYPSGGIILGRSAVKQAYRTGKGGIVIRSKCEIEDHNGRARIVVKELPYQVNKALLIENIAEQVKEKKLDGIAHINDESDRFGMRMVIDLKKDVSAQVVLNNLYKQSNLQITTGITFLALHKGVPKTMNLKEMLEAYIAHQVDVIKRRTVYLLNKALEREHILQGLVIALDNLDEVISIIRTSRERSVAQERLIERFGFSDRQANAILDMRLSRLTSLEVEKIRIELSEITLLVADYRDILANESRVYSIIKTELSEIRDQFHTPRRSELSYDLSEINVADLIEKEDVVVSMTFQGYVKRISVTEYKSQNRGGVGVSAHKTKDDDFISRLLVCNTHDDLLFFTNKGKVYRIKAFEVPKALRTAKGRAIVNLLSLEGDEKVTNFLSIKDYENGSIMMLTRNGLIKKSSIKLFENIRINGKIAISLLEGDELIATEVTNGNNELIVASSDGHCIKFTETAIREIGRKALGVKAMKLPPDVYMVDMDIVKEGSEVVTVTENGFGKRVDISNFHTQGRNGKGVKAGTFNEKTGKLINLKLVSADDDIIIIADNGTMIRIRADMINTIGRTSQGVKLMRLKGDGKVACMSLTPREEDAEYDNVESDESISD